VINNIIIGAGFSAGIVKALFNKKIKIIGCLNHSFLSKFYLRRKLLECNKLFALKSYSYGTIKFNTKKIKLHDRLIVNGNSDVWGGHINLKSVSSTILKLFKKNYISAEKLCFNKTGTISNNNDILQLQSNNGEIIKAKQFFGKVYNGYLDRFIVENNEIFIFIKKNNSFYKIKVKNLFLCIGTVQLIDLLYRSKYIFDNDTIKLSEFYSKYEYSFSRSIKKTNNTIIKYRFSRAVGHFLGTGSFAKFLKILNFIPVYIEQIFYKKKINIAMKIDNGIITNKYSKKKLKLIFGNSIHYSNMTINEININKFLLKISNRIIGIGMPFVNQKIPGPIINEIINDAELKIKNMTARF